MNIYKILYSSSQLLNAEMYYSNYDRAFNEFYRLRQLEDTYHLALFKMSDDKNNDFNQYECITEYAFNGDYQYTEEADLMERLHNLETVISQNLRDIIWTWKSTWNIKISYETYTRLTHGWHELLEILRAEVEPQLKKKIEEENS